MYPAPPLVWHVHVEQTRCTNFVGYTIQVNMHILQTLIHTYQNVHLRIWYTHNIFVCVCVCVYVYKIWGTTYQPIPIYMGVMNTMVPDGFKSVVSHNQRARFPTSKCWCRFLMNLTFGRPFGTFLFFHVYAFELPRFR